MSVLKAHEAEIISSSSLGTSDSDELLALVADADEVKFHLGNSFRADSLKSILLACALSRRTRRISLRLGRGGVTSVLEDALARSFLGPLLWHASRPEPTDISSDVLSLSRPAHADPARKLFCVSTELLDCTTREGFQSDLARWMVKAAIVIDDEVFRRVAALIYEPSANVEEHGSSRLTEAKTLDPRHVFRCLAVRLHNEPGPTLPSIASDYLSKYAEFHDERTRWLEVTVADAGMGIAYPRYLRRARELGSSQVDLYEADILAERWQLDEVLSKRISTKGNWGRVRSAYPAVGDGMMLIKRNIGRLRGFGAVRAGRCSASIACPAPIVEESTIAALEYVVDPAEHSLFLGTAWHFLLPLDPQLRMAV